MVRWSRLRDGGGRQHVVSGLGALYVVAAAARFASVAASGDPLVEAVLNFAEVGGPGLVLLYGGVRLPRSELRPEAYPRVVAWCLGGAAALLGIVGLLVLDPGVNVNHPLWSTVLAAAIGNVGGLAIGANEARAISRAREAEEHERRLREQNDRLESFASMLAHELRNPLNIAQIYLPRAAEGNRDAADEAMTALDRIEEMIEILLVMARSSDSEIDRERVALDSVAADAWADLSAESATLVVETDMTVRADPVHLRHLFENLFRNAVEHGSTSPRSGTREDVDERSSSARETASHDAAEHGGGVEVRVGDLGAGFYVEDDGPGIAEAERATVFDPGYTTDASGIGLGLTFVAQLVETYDWNCRVTESESGGARFEFTDVDVAAPERRSN